jgi:gluconate kinase
MPNQAKRGATTGLTANPSSHPPPLQRLVGIHHREVYRNVIVTCSAFARLHRERMRERHHCFSLGAQGALRPHFPESHS